MNLLIVLFLGVLLDLTRSDILFSEGFYDYENLPTQHAFLYGH